MTALPAAPRPVPTIQHAPSPAVLGDERNEQQLLGLTMLRGAVDPSNSVFKKILHFKEEYFTVKAHRIIFRAMMLISADGMNVEYDSVLDRLKKMENKKVAGHFAIQDVPEAFLESICALQAGNVDLLIELITIAWIRRHDVEAAHERIKWASDGNIPTQQYLDMAEEQDRENHTLYAAVRGRNAESMTEGMARLEVNLAKDKTDSSSRDWMWHTGFQAITNHAGGGYKKGKVYFYGARPGGGKSLMLQAAAMSVINQEGRPYILSLEMSPQAFWERMLVAESGVELERINNGNMSKAEVARVTESLGRLKAHKMGNQFRIEYMRMPTLAQMRMNVARQIHEWGANFLLLDYATFRKITPANDRANPTIQQGHISQWLVNIAEEFQIPVVSAAQMNRNIDKRGGAPEMSDLEYAAAMEQDADFVGLFQDEDTKLTAGDYAITNCHVVKSRFGSTGIVPLKVFKHLSRFEEL
jgi:replicative DNA helicase